LKEKLLKEFHIKKKGGAFSVDILLKNRLPTQFAPATLPVHHFSSFLIIDNFPFAWL
jgi:hypothetical protein